MSETVYASDLCKLYLENEITDLKYRNELYNQISEDLFGNTDIFYPFPGSYRIVSDKHKIIFNMIDYLENETLEITYSGLNSFTKRNSPDGDHFYLNPFYGKISEKLYEEIMEKIKSETI